MSVGLLVFIMFVVVMGGCWAAPTARQFEGAGSVWALAVSPDGKRIASGGVGETVQLRDIATGEVKATLSRQTPFVAPMSQNFVMSLAFSSDGAFLAAGYNDGSVALWDLASGAVYRNRRLHQGSVHSLAFSRDGRWMASGANSSGDDIVQLWNMQTRQV